MLQCSNLICLFRFLCLSDIRWNLLFWWREIWVVWFGSIHFIMVWKKYIVLVCNYVIFDRSIHGFRVEDQNIILDLIVTLKPWMLFWQSIWYKNLFEEAAKKRNKKCEMSYSNMTCYCLQAFVMETKIDIHPTLR